MKLIIKFAILNYILKLNVRSFDTSKQYDNRNEINFTFSHLVTVTRHRRSCIDIIKKQLPTDFTEYFNIS